MTTIPVATSLSNIAIGGKWNQQLSVAFLAAHPSPLAAFRYYRIFNKSGYSSGTGGQIVYALWTDAGGGAPGAPIAPSTLISHGHRLADPAFPAPSSGYGDFPLVGFPAPPVLTAGHWYHLVFVNVDPAPTVNFVSADFLYDATVLDQLPDMRVFIKPASESWQLAGKGAYIASPVQLYYANGLRQGYPWIAAGSQYPPNGLESGAQYGFLED